MATTNAETFFPVKSWEEAKRRSKGYEDDQIVSALCESLFANPPWTSQSKNIYFDARSLELCCALYRAMENYSKSISVADIGGGNGYMSIYARSLIPKVSWEWVVYESKAITDAYSQFESQVRIKWKEYKYELCSYYDIALLSCAIQYFKDPIKAIFEAGKNCKYIILMRIPFHKGPDDIITIQKPDNGIYKTNESSWPAWFFSRDKFDYNLNDIGDIIYRWKTPTEQLFFNGEMLTLEGLLIRTN